jgi:hypothetical protein
VNSNLLALGLQPTLLSDDTIAGLIARAHEHAGRVDTSLIPPRVAWRPDAAPLAGTSAVA